MVPPVIPQTFLTDLSTCVLPKKPKMQLCKTRLMHRRTAARPHAVNKHRALIMRFYGLRAGYTHRQNRHWQKKPKHVHRHLCVVTCRFQVMRWTTRKQRTQLPLIYTLKSVTHSRNLSLSVTRLNWLSRCWSRCSKTSYQECRLKDF